MTESSLASAGMGWHDGSYQSVQRQRHQIRRPVTYDESGNVIPLSQRFTPSNDIRFSLAPRSLASVADTVLASKCGRQSSEISSTPSLAKSSRLPAVMVIGALTKFGNANRARGFVRGSDADGCEYRA